MTDYPKLNADWWNLPNALTVSRILGSPFLILLASNSQFGLLIGLVAILVLTEWLDGYLARRWKQQSALGARLDTVADAIFYCSMLIAIIVTDPKLIRNEAGWIALAIGSYLLSWLSSWAKFGRLPSYHTWAAKSVWFVIAPGVICLLLGYSPWVFRISMVCVALANLEAILITWRLPECKVDVPTLWHAIRQRG